MFNSMLGLFMFYAGSGLLLIALSIPLIRRRVRPNWIYGFRVPRTVNNPGHLVSGQCSGGQVAVWIRGGDADLLGRIIPAGSRSRGGCVCAGLCYSGITCAQCERGSQYDVPAHSLEANKSDR